MNNLRRRFPVYSHFMRLYPKEYRDKYEEQILQTTADMLDEAGRTGERIAIWLKLTLDVPFNIGRQQYDYLGENMSKNDKQGKLAGMPYDLRRPTADRYKSRFWNPSAPFITPKAFGWGYTFNFYRLFHPYKRR
jgi:hypothetical protein